MKKFFASLLALALLCCNASATTVAFTAPSGFAGGSVNGFTFSGKWGSYGSNSQPFMNSYTQSHAVSYDAGTFAFSGMSLAATPWDGYGYGSGALDFDFKDGLGNIIASNSMLLTGGDSFVNFSQNVAGVHEIYFHATNGYWPRLGSIDVGTIGAAAVPEPGSVAMLLTGLGLLAFTSRRRKSSKDKA